MSTRILPVDDHSVHFSPGSGRVKVLQEEVERSVIGQSYMNAGGKEALNVMKC